MTLVTVTAVLTEEQLLTLLSRFTGRYYLPQYLSVDGSEVTIRSSLSNVMTLLKEIQGA